MSTTAHTPGPWNIEMCLTGGVFGTTSVYVVSGLSGERQIASVNSQDGYGEQMANAFVMAAAHDLLEACEAMHKYDQFDWENADVFIDLYEAAMVLMKAAIKKAKGE